jgi:hypothetical protein
MANGGGFGQPGPRTYEHKDWLTTIKKGIACTIVIWLGLCVGWLAVSLGLWLVAPDSGIIRWFGDRPRVWASVHVWMLLPCLIGMIVWARQELLDEDWTSLSGKHGLSGIMPMTPLVRMVMFLRWLKQDRAQKPKPQNAEIELRARLERIDNEPTE